MSGFTIAWLLWIAMFLAVEGVAIFRKAPGDTLSEHVWSLFKIKDKPAQWTIRRTVLAVFLVWLLVHMVAGI